VSQHWPLPTTRAVVIAAFGLVPALLAVVVRQGGWAALIIDLTLLGAVVVDWSRAPKGLRVTRVLDAVISSSVRHGVKLVLESPERVRGEFRESVPAGPHVERGRQRFDFVGQETFEWWLTPKTRGDLQLGDVWVRLEGPWRLSVRQFRVPSAQHVKVYPDVRALSRDAVWLARATDDSAKRLIRVRSEGREFEALRDYRVGDDLRSIDWKATARRGRNIVRVHQPERNQTVLLLLDCGRHMAGEVLGRRKLDHAVDAGLRLAKVSLDRGDQVGVMAFSTTVRAWLPPRKGQEQLTAIVQLLYRVEATLDESDYGAALDVAFARGVRRSLVVIMTDLLDSETSATLVRRTLRLVPRHLPLIISMRDDELHRVAHETPTTRHEVLERVVAARLETESKATVARLRDAGARVLTASATSLGPDAVNAYLDIKARGLL
jgi:uncharacterized protein (DUF58 family)